MDAICYARPMPRRGRLSSSFDETRQPPSRAGISRTLIRAAVALAIGALPFVYYWGAVIHRWYTSAFLMDFGWFNYLVSGQPGSLQDPSAMDTLPYFATHVALLLPVFGAMSKLLGLTGAQPMALMLGVGFGGAAVMAFVVMEWFLRPAGAILAIAAAAVAATVYAFSAVPRAIVDYPHMEILYVPLALLTLHLLFKRRFRWAWAALAVCLVEREDSGLHLACILGAYLVLATFEERTPPNRLRELAPYLGVCLAYPFLVILWQRTHWPDHSTFAAIYTGSPPYQHLTRALVAEHLEGLAGTRIWVTLTLATTLVLVPIYFRWTVLVGLVASLPWLALNLTAHSPNAGGLFAYYGFPFLVTALAPFIVSAAPAPEREERPGAIVAF